MNYNYISECTNCDFSIDYRPYWVNYHYQGLSRESEYPKIDFAWCNNCRKFTPVQLGFKISEIKEKQTSTNEKIVTLKRKLIKTSSIRNEIEDLKVIANDVKTIINLTEGYDTLSSCCECGSSDIVFKDIEHQMWRCPKCRIGLLKLKKEIDEEDILYRLGEEFITPVKFDWHIEDYISYKAFCCSFDIINNECVYYLYVSRHKIGIKKLYDNYILTLIDRLSIIYAVLIKIMGLKIREDIFIQNMISSLKSAKIIDAIDDINLIINRLKNKIDFFVSEIEIELGCSMFLPIAIITTLENPDKTPTREISANDPFETLKHWKVVSDTIHAYFKTIA